MLFYRVIGPKPLRTFEIIMSAANETVRWSERDRFCTKIARALFLLWIAGPEAPHDWSCRSGGMITLLFTRQVGLLSRCASTPWAQHFRDMDMRTREYYDWCNAHSANGRSLGYRS